MRRVPKPQPGPRPTLLEMHRDAPWLWLWCPKCGARRAVTLVPYMIIWGMHASSDVLRGRFGRFFA